MEVTWIHVEEGLYSINISCEYLSSREPEGVRSVSAVATKTGGTRAAWERSPSRVGGQPQAHRTTGQRVDSWCLCCPFLAQLTTDRPCGPGSSLSGVKLFFAFTPGSPALCLPPRNPTRGPLTLDKNGDGPPRTRLPALPSAPVFQPGTRQLQRGRTH